MFGELSRWFRLLIAPIIAAKTPAVEEHAPNCLCCFADSPLRERGAPVWKMMRFQRFAGDDHHSPPALAQPRHTGDPHPPGVTPAVRQIATAWPKLPPHIQDAILTLIDAARLQGDGDDPP